MIPLSTCKDCKFFSAIKQCRRYPPTIVEGTLISQDRSVWPYVDEYDYCGEFKPKPTVAP